MAKKKPMHLLDIEHMLSTWIILNEGLLEQDDEGFLHVLLSHELNHKCRKQFVLRIHSRLNKVRADRERDELLAKIEELQQAA